MDKELILQTLGILETNNEEEIRAAYRERLKNTNPEDDPEGFKRLRQAYEEGLILAKDAMQEENAEGAEEKNEIDLWIDQVETLYLDLLSRHKLELWEKLLSDPVCEDLDTSLEAREKLIVFLMNHVHLPHEVWKIIDKTFEITADIEILQEKYPINFLNYMRYYVEHDTFIPYELFEYRDWDGKEVNGDGYIDKYLEIKRRIDSGEIEDCARQLEDLRAYHIYHPFEDVEKLRILVIEENCAEGAALADSLIKRYPDCDYICLHAGQIKWQMGEREQAYGLWKKILEKDEAQTGMVSSSK